METVNGYYQIADISLLHARYQGSTSHTPMSGCKFEYVLHFLKEY